MSPAAIESYSLYYKFRTQNPKHTAVYVWHRKASEGSTSFVYIYVYIYHAWNADVDTVYDHLYWVLSQLTHAVICSTYYRVKWKSNYIVKSENCWWSHDNIYFSVTAVLAPHPHPHFLYSVTLVPLSGVPLPLMSRARFGCQPVKRFYHRILTN